MLRSATCPVLSTGGSSGNLLPVFGGAGQRQRPPSGRLAAAEEGVLSLVRSRTVLWALALLYAAAFCALPVLYASSGKIGGAPSGPGGREAALPGGLPAAEEGR